MIQQELEEHGEEIRLLNHFNTDAEQKLNWQTLNEVGKGFIRDDKGQVIGREVARIPVEEAAMLEANYDLDYLCFTHNNDRAAFRRLLKRFPHWKCCEGGV